MAGSLSTATIIRVVRSELNNVRVLSFFMLVIIIPKRYTCSKIADDNVFESPGRIHVRGDILYTAKRKTGSLVPESRSTISLPMHRFNMRRDTMRLVNLVSSSGGLRRRTRNTYILLKVALVFDVRLEARSKLLAIAQQS